MLPACMCALQSLLNSMARLPLVSLGFGISVQDFYALEWPRAFLDSKVSESVFSLSLFLCVSMLLKEAEDGT